MADRLDELAQAWPGLAASFAGQTIVVVGDLMLDHTAAGRARRLSPEAPVPVLLLDEEWFGLGGAANVARNLAALGARVRLAGVIGDDEDGDRLLAICRAELIDIDAVVRDRRRRTTRKTRFVTDAQQMLRVDRETPAPLPDRAEAALVDRLEAAPADAVIVSDYAKGVLTRRIVASAIDLARRSEAPSVVDPKGADFARYAGCTIVTPNAEEAAAATGMPVRTPVEGEAAGRRLLDVAGCEAVVVTHGSQGVGVVTSDASWHLPAHAREVFDVAGAGDTLVAALALASAAGAALPAATSLANIAASLVVAAKGVSVTTRDELTRAIAALSGAERRQQAAV